MNKTTTTTKVFLNEQSKDTKKERFKAQKIRVFEYLKTHIATASMVTDALNIPQKNITRYKRDFEKCNMLWEVCKTHCKLTGFKASYLTTDPEKAPEPQQLSLFDNESMGGN